MKRARTALAVAVSLILSASLFAQSKPGAPGPPSTAPQVIVDSTGATVGDVIQLTDGLGKAYVKYILPNGDAGVLVAGSGGINGTVVPRIGSDLNYTQYSIKVYFTSDNCTGDAYVDYGVANAATQLTRVQTLTMSGLLPSQLPPPTPTPGCPMLPAYADEWLYTTVSGACPVAYDLYHLATFKSAYGYPGMMTPAGMMMQAPGGGPFCVNPPGGSITIPNANYYNGAFVLYSPVENLSLKYKAPFSVK